MVEIKDREFTDTDLAEVLRKLEVIGLYGLDLSHTAISDEGVRQFIGRESLFLVSLRGTRISTDAVELLAQTNLRSIDVRDTPVRLEHLQPFGDFNALNLLYVSDEHITDGDVAMVDNIPYLNAIWVNDEPTSRRIVNQVNKNLPRMDGLTEAEKQRFIDVFSLKVAGDIRYVLD
jgi:hypothetical protein